MNPVPLFKDNIMPRLGATLAATLCTGVFMVLHVTCPALAQPRDATQPWPAGPIRLVVPFAPGGSTDISARVFAENLRPLLGQTIVVDNRPGAAGSIAGDIVAKAAPTGYTILMASATLVANMNLYKNLPYNFLTDLAPVVQSYNSNNVLVVNQKVPAASLAEFIAYVKNGKNSINYGSAGHGSSQHLSAALFNHMVTGNMVHVPYKGGAPAVIDLVGGSIQTIFAPLIEVLPHINAGTVKALGVCGPKRSPLLPNVPPISDLLPGYASSSWNGIFAPVKTPADIVNKLNAAMRTMLKQPNVRAHLAEGDKEPVGNTPEEFKKFIAIDAERLRMMVKISGAKFD
jgi:tripartite-type tricarboxylate transporter receptor subunit TctC